MKEFVALSRRFYGPSASVVAPRLLGHWLIRRTEEGVCGGIIVETEAYLVDDPAAHSYGGRTERNRIMWGPPGFSYVYFIYGNHFCFNAVCRPEGIAEAVLVRAVEPLLGLDLMQKRRAVKEPRQLTNGPGKLCAAMQIDRNLDGADLCDAASPLFIARNPARGVFVMQRGPAVISTRIGITKAAALPLRFYLAGNAFVSRRGMK